MHCSEDLYRVLYPEILERPSVGALKLRFGFQKVEDTVKQILEDHVCISDCSVLGGRSQEAWTHAVLASRTYCSG